MRGLASFITLSVAVLTACGGGGGGEGDSVSGSQTPNQYYSSTALSKTFNNEIFHTNDFEYIQAYGSTYLLLVGGKTNEIINQESDFLDSYARAFKITNGIVGEVDSKLNIVDTKSNQPQSIIKYDFNGDGVKDFVIGTFGPDAGSTPGAKDIVLESDINGWKLVTTPNVNFPTESVAVGSIGSETFFYSSSQLCLNSNYSPFFTIKRNGQFIADDSWLPDYMRGSTYQSPCSQQEYIGATVYDVDDDGNDDLILGTSDDAQRITWTNYVGSQIIFGNGIDFKGRNINLPPTMFDVNGVNNTTVQSIAATKLWNNEVYILISYYQSNVLGNPAIGGGIQLIRYKNGNVTDVTAQAFTGHPTFNANGSEPYQFGGPMGIKFVDVNRDNCLDIVSNRKPGLWINDCNGQFVWGYDFIKQFINTDRLFFYENGSNFGFITPYGSEENGKYNHLKALRNIPTPSNGRFD